MAASPNTAAANPYMQSLYAASPYALQAAGAPGLIQMGSAAATPAGQNPMTNCATAAAGGTGNPLLDAYASHYASLLGAYGGAGAAVRLHLFADGGRAAHHVDGVDVKFA